ncbi:hypothetical protein GQ53DRAFT_517734 [Thozetella sp. PMI_491]|nr:hypothetical protein GQ53DRAFT_517734 [Thozetella sp. PMI_491]
MPARPCPPRASSMMLSTLVRRERNEHLFPPSVSSPRESRIQMSLRDRPLLPWFRLHPEIWRPSHVQRLGRPEAQKHVGQQRHCLTSVCPPPLPPLSGKRGSGVWPGCQSPRAVARLFFAHSPSPWTISNRERNKLYASCARRLTWQSGAHPALFGWLVGRVAAG